MHSTIIELYYFNFRYSKKASKTYMNKLYKSLINGEISKIEQIKLINKKAKWAPMPSKNGLQNSLQYTILIFFLNFKILISKLAKKLSTETF